MERFRFMEIRELPRPEFYQAKIQTKISSLSQTNKVIVQKILQKSADDKN